MKKYVLDACLSLSLLFLGGCTSDETKVQELALEKAKEAFARELKAEFSLSISGKRNLQQTAVQTLIDKSQFEVQKVEVQDNNAFVLVQVLTVPLKARSALVEIIGKLDEKKERNFNVSNALHLILRQLDLTETRSLQVYKIRLKKSGEWQILEEENKSDTHKRGAF